MKLLPEKLENLAPYQPNGGEYEIRLDANESFMDLPDKIKQKLAEKVLKIEYNRYPDPLAKKVTKAFAEYFEIDEKRCVAGNGSDELISVIINCFAKRGDKVLVLSPDFSMYGFYSYLAELETCNLYKNEEMEVTSKEILEEVLKKKPKILIFSNPCNPTGKGLPTEEIKKIAENCGCLFVLDEAYMDFYGDSLLKDLESFENLIILRTCSKAFGLAAIRLGFAISSVKIAGLLTAAKSPYNVNAVTQAFGEVVLSDREFLRLCTKRIIESKESLFLKLDLLSKEYSDIFKACDTKTNFVILKTNFSKEIFNDLKCDKIAVRCFNGFLRITAGSGYENERLIASLKKSAAGIERSLKV